MGNITGSTETLFRQAMMTAAEYFQNAIAEIDEALGSGYAKEHPELIAAFMKVAASDFHTTCFSKAHSDAIENLANSIRELSEKVEGIAG